MYVAENSATVHTFYTLRFTVNLHYEKVSLKITLKNYCYSENHYYKRMQH